MKSKKPTVKMTKKVIGTIKLIKKHMSPKKTKGTKYV